MLPSWPGAAAAYKRADKLLARLCEREADAQGKAHCKRGRSISTFRYNPSDDVRAWIDALDKGDEEQIKAFNLTFLYLDSSC